MNRVRKALALYFAVIFDNCQLYEIILAGIIHRYRNLIFFNSKSTLQKF
jgi:hypothetical protein